MYVCSRVIIRFIIYLFKIALKFLSFSSPSINVLEQDGKKFSTIIVFSNAYNDRDIPNNEEKWYVCTDALRV